jgi:hypothetical protein
MTTDVPLAALAVSYWGQDLAADAVALARLRDRPTGLRLFAICLGGAEPPPDIGFDRVLRLPLGPEQLPIAEAIGLQLCLNEESRLAGTIRSLQAAELDAASRHFGQLGSGQADVIVIPEDDPQAARLFLSARAAFLASSWGALAGELAPQRPRIASALLALAARKGVMFLGVGPGYVPLERCDAAQLASLADPIRQKLGLFIGERRPPTLKPVRRVAVVTPYYKEPDAELRRMLDSVSAQTSPCHHIVVSDGFPSDVARAPGVTHIELGAAHRDNGNTPRYVGALVALAQGYDAIAFLDADNWFEPRHIERLMARQHETGAGAVFSLRNNYLPDGTKVPMEEEMDAARLHADTSCMFITRGCEFALHLWGQMPMEWGPVCDRVVFVELAGHRVAWTKNRTLNFKSHYMGSYIALGRPIPEDIHQIPPQLIADLEFRPPAFRERAVSRTGRVIKVIGV